MASHFEWKWWRNRCCNVPVHSPMHRTTTGRYGPWRLGLHAASTPSPGATHTTLPCGMGYTSIEIKVNYLRPVSAGNGALTARGRVTKPGRRVASLKARSDGQGRVVANCVRKSADLPSPGQLSGVADFSTVDVTTDRRGDRGCEQDRQGRIEEGDPGSAGGHRQPPNHLSHALGPFELSPAGSGACRGMGFTGSRRWQPSADLSPARCTLPPLQSRRRGRPVHREHPRDDWYGWFPSDEGSTPIGSDEPLVVIVFGILKPRHLLGFVKNNVHAASRAAFIPVIAAASTSHRNFRSSTPPSACGARRSWRDYAYARVDTGTRWIVRAVDTHRVGSICRSDRWRVLGAGTGLSGVS